MIKTFTRIQCSKIDFARIYFQTKLTFQEISKQKAGKELTYHILYFVIYFESVAIQDFYVKRKLQYKNTINKQSPALVYFF